MVKFIFIIVICVHQNDNIEDVIDMNDLNSFMENIPNNENSNDNSNDMNELTEEYLKSQPNNIKKNDVSKQKIKKSGSEKLKKEFPKEMAKKLGSSYSIKMIPNTKLNIDAENILKFETYSVCIQKTGFLGYVKTHSTKINIIEATPIYVSINIYHLSFFESTEDSTLFKAIKLSKITSDHVHI